MIPFLTEILVLAAAMLVASSARLPAKTREPALCVARKKVKA